MLSPACGRRGSSSSWCHTCRAAPNAPPASPEAGCTQIFSNGPSRWMRPFATQLSATPPARHRFGSPVCACTCRAALSMTSSVTSLNRRRDVHLPFRDRAFGPARRTSKDAVELLGRHGEALAIVEVRHVHPDGPVGLDFHHLADDAIDIARLAVRRQPHELVFARIDLEPAVVRERRVEETERMRELLLVRDLEMVAATDTVRRGGPLTDTVHRQDRRLLER